MKKVFRLISTYHENSKSVYRSSAERKKKKKKIIIIIISGNTCLVIER